MDSNTMYAAAMVGRDVDYQDDIIREAWAEEEGFEGFISQTTLDSIRTTTACSGLQGSAKSNCINALNNCGNDLECKRLAEKYIKALKKGYSGSFEDFKKRSANLARIGQLGLSYIGDLLSGIGTGGSQGDEDFCLNNPTDPICTGEDFDSKPRTGLYIIIGLVAVAGIGAAIYFANKNK